jgi:hypothetical protein
MAYVPGFRYDIFISYPRENNRADPEGVQWVREFHRCLRTAIDNQIPSNEKPEIFFDDHDFEGGQHIEALLDDARQSAIFLAIISPPYMAPDKFTLKELRVFCDARSRDEQVIVSICFLPIKGEDYPPELEGPKRFPFYWTNESDVAVPLTPRTNPTEYTSKLYTVAYQLRNRLDEMRQKRSPSALDQKKGPFSGKTVLLGQVTDDLIDTRDEVREYIEKLGAIVIPSGEYPPWGPDFIKSFEAELVKSDLFIQLLSKVRSQRDGETLSCAQFQSKAATGAGKSMLQWREPSDISKVQHYDKSILELASAMSLVQFKAAVRKKLEQLSASRDERVNSEKLVPVKSHDPFIYITAHPEDLDRALKLKTVADTLGAARIMEDENKLRDFLSQVPDAAAVVFLYGDAPRKFVDEWLAKYRKLKTTQFKTCPQLEAVYYAPPPKSETERKLRTGWKGLREFGSQETFILEDMRKIFAELRGDISG